MQITLVSAKVYNQYLPGFREKNERKAKSSQRFGASSVDVSALLAQQNCVPMKMCLFFGGKSSQGRFVVLIFRLCHRVCLQRARELFRL